MTFDELRIRAEAASRRAEEAYHRLTDRYDSFLEQERSTRVSRRRFSTLVDRIRQSGAPYGAHTAVFRDDGRVLLVRHDDVDRWVLPGGGVDRGEVFRETARRELAEEAGVEASYEGLAMVTRVQLSTRGASTWGVLPVFEARADGTVLDVSDPDGEIVAADWFETLPADTRDREDLLELRSRRG